MRMIVYYVAISLDGYISGRDGDITSYVGTGSGVARYLEDLKAYDTVIMGKNTYEFGYRFGLKPGQPAYPHMDNYIFSSSLKFEHHDPKLKIRPVSLEEIDNLKKRAGTDIYLCGGGTFAGWLLDNHRIDVLKIKLNPIVLGQGVKLFGLSSTALHLELLDSEKFDFGLQIITYAVK